MVCLGGSLFLFDRKVLRYFRKDGHNWRKKNDQKTVKEAHERLKVSNFGYQYLLSNDPFQCWSTIIFQWQPENKTEYCS
jgi:hypothetical protein